MQKIILLLLVGLFTSCQQQEEEPVEQAPTTDTTIPVTVGQIEVLEEPVKINTTGLIQASSNTKYAFKIGGIIERLYVDEGDRIKKGQLLATLRLTEIEAQYRQAELALEKAQRDQTRVTNLYQDSIATLEDVQNTQTQLDVAKETLTQVDFNRSYAKIYASAAGYVATKLANIGEVVGPGTPVFVVNDAAGTTGWTLECTVNDRQWAQIRPGDACAISLDAYPSQTLRGVVSTKSAQANAVSGAFAIEVDVQNQQLELAVGMYGSVEITTRQVDRVLAIPYDALVEANGKKGFVYVTEDGESVEKIAVNIANITPEKVHLSSLVPNVRVDPSVDPTPKIILGNSAFLSPSATIKIVE